MYQYDVSKKKKAENASKDLTNIGIGGADDHRDTSISSTLDREKSGWDIVQD